MAESVEQQICTHFCQKLEQSCSETISIILPAIFSIKYARRTTTQVSALMSEHCKSKVEYSPWLFCTITEYEQVTRKVSYSKAANDCLTMLTHHHFVTKHNRLRTDLLQLHVATGYISEMNSNCRWQIIQNLER